MNDELATLRESLRIRRGKAARYKILADNIQTRIDAILLEIDQNQARLPYGEDTIGSRKGEAGLAQEATQDGGQTAGQTAV